MNISIGTEVSLLSKVYWPPRAYSIGHLLWHLSFNATFLPRKSHFPRRVLMYTSAIDLSTNLHLHLTIYTYIQLFTRHIHFNVS